MHTFHVKYGKPPAYFYPIRYNSIANVSIKVSLEKLFFSACTCSFFLCTEMAYVSKYESEVRVRSENLIKVLLSHCFAAKGTPSIM